MAGSVKEISSSITPDVWLKIGQLAWSRLPQAMRTRIQAALDALTGIRADIARAARVQTMPLIEVVAELWRNDTDDATIDGRMKPVRRHGQEFLGIQLPIQTLLCDDNRVLRAVTVHEFSHCFWLAWTVLDASDAGLTKIDDDPNFDPTNAEHDESQMVIPSQWFGEVDAASFAYHHDVANGKVLHRYLSQPRGSVPDQDTGSSISDTTAFDR